MRKPSLSQEITCPVCGCRGNQSKKGFNRSGTQRCICKECGATHTLDPKQKEYPEEVKQAAIKAYYSGATGRGVGRLFNMSKANVYNWIKKTKSDVENSLVEMDELYWFINNKATTETKENIYIITMANRNPRIIIDFSVSTEKTSAVIQEIVDRSPYAEKYCTDGYFGYLDTIFPGEHIRNIHNKKDTYTVEGINADLRHYIPILRRRNRCFARSIETLTAVVEFFVEAYNRFGMAKFKYRQSNPNRTIPFGLVDFLFRR